MKRRSFLAMLGLAPVTGVAAAATAPVAGSMAIDAGYPASTVEEIRKALKHTASTVKACYEQDLQIAQASGVFRTTVIETDRFVISSSPVREPYLFDASGTCLNP